MTNGWDPKYDPTWIKYAEVNRNDIIREGMKPSNIPGTAGDIGGFYRIRARWKSNR